MNQIKFSHTYPKLHGQRRARLLKVEIRDRENFTDKFIDYDTTYDGGKYPLPKGRYLLLLFLGDENIPFTTVRWWTEEKDTYYCRQMYKMFEVVVEKEAEGERQ